MIKNLIITQIDKDFDPVRDVPIGPWCFIGAENIYPEWYKLPFVEPIKTIDQMKSIDEVSRSIANKITLEWGEKLNKKHKVDYSPVYWRFVLIAWVLFSVQVILLRIIHIKEFISAHSQAGFNVSLAPLTPPIKPDGFIDLLYHQRQNHKFDFWVTSLVIRLIAPPSWNVIEPNNNLDWTNFSYIPEPESSINLEVPNFLGNLARMVFGRLCFGSVPGTKFSKVFFSIYLNLIPKGGPGKIYDYCGPDNNQHLIPTKFFEALDTYLNHTLPISYDANFKKLSDQASKQKVVPGRIFINNFMPSSELQRLEFARALDAGEKFITVQHGSGYGTSLLNCWSAEFEYPYHSFFTWGWESHGDFRGNFISLPSPLMSKVRNKHREKNKCLAMVTTKTDLRDCRLIGPRPLHWLEYREKKLLFIKNINTEIRRDLLYFPYSRGTSDLEDEAYLKKFIPELTIQNNGLNSKMLSVRLLILDCPGTTLNIAMAANVPTICFWNKRAFPWVPEAQPYFDELAACKILHYTPESAAHHTNNSWNSVGDWWNNPATQKARSRWATKFAHSEKYWWWKWLKQLTETQIKT